MDGARVSGCKAAWIFPGGEGWAYTARLRVVDLSEALDSARGLRGVSLEVQAGDVHALVSRNEAGKSTLVRILAGVHALVSGGIEVGDGRKVDGGGDHQMVRGRAEVAFDRGDLDDDGRMEGGAPVVAPREGVQLPDAAVWMGLPIPVGPGAGPGMRGSTRAVASDEAKLGHPKLDHPTGRLEQDRVTASG